MSICSPSSPAKMTEKFFDKNGKNENFLLTRLVFCDKIVLPHVLGNMKERVSVPKDSEFF